MENQIYDDLAIEEIAKDKFGMTFDIDHVVARSIPVSSMATATIFLTTKKILYVYITGKAHFTLGDVTKMIARMGLRAELYLPPKGQSAYFDNIGRDKYRDVFPSRVHTNAEDIIYYRTLAPYNPALVQINEVKKGEIFQYERDSHTGWRLAVKFAYRRIKTS
ncbi:MAG: hypothetical protein ACSLEY_03535 [Candidatus Saccharimonadales bacterium]